MDGALTNNTNLRQSRCRRNGDEGVLHTPKVSRTGALSLDALSCHTLDMYF